MKGIVLAGGLGTRLYPLTKITNKHLLPLYDRPMIFFPIAKLADSGIDEIMIVTGGYNAGDFLRLLGDGSQFGLKHLHYVYQAHEGGIAEAVGLCEKYVDGDNVAVMLGDNLIEQDLSPAVDLFERNGVGARVFLKRVTNPGEYGVVEFDGKRISRIIEKPRRPPTSFAVVGFYLYDNSVFEIIRTLNPSKRKELEISDVNGIYVERRMLAYEILRGGWADAGESIAAYNKAIDFARKLAQAKPGRMQLKSNQDK
jgi:glucose-1-phosphate thymidylyltransferase